MDTIRAKIRVGDDGRVEGQVGRDIPPGEHDVLIVVAASNQARRPSIADWPVHDWPWPSDLSLRREDIYGDDGR